MFASAHDRTYEQYMGSNTRVIKPNIINEARFGYARFFNSIRLMKTEYKDFQLAVFGANGPLSNPPTNFIWMRYAKLEFYRGPSGPFAVTPREVNGEVTRLDPAMDAIVGPNPKIFKLAEGFQFTEGPIWIRDGGYLLFSDPNANTQYN